MKNNKFSLLWFILGLGSETQVIASMSFSDAIVLFSAPFLLPKVINGMRRDGVLRLWILSLLLVFGCAVACVANHCAMIFVVRGMAVTCIISCSIVFGYWILRAAPGGFKWMLLGVALSMVICTFAFQHAGEIAVSGGDAGEAAVDSIVSGPLFWITRIGAFLTLPTKGWYLHTPILFDILVVLFVAIFSVVTSASGRAAALGALGMAGIIILGGKSIHSMRRFCRHFLLVAGLAVVCLYGVNAVYRVSALNGWLGEKSREKYEHQSQGSSSIIRLLIGGRSESFIGLFACWDKPIVGWGPWALDTNDYYTRFIFKYGSDDDVEMLVRRRQYLLSHGLTARVFLIQCHSYITEFWLWYGIFGLIFWLYVVFVVLRYLKSDAWAVPQWFAWIAAGVPAYLWSVFFSPFGHRVVNVLFVVACLMARAARKGTFNLPYDMMEEIQVNRKR